MHHTHPPNQPPNPQVVQIAAAPAVIGAGDGPIKVTSEAAKPASAAGSTKSPTAAGAGAGGHAGSPVVVAVTAAAGYVTAGGKDIKAKYDIDPREIGHGHYGVVRKARCVA